MSPKCSASVGQCYGFCDLNLPLEISGGDRGAETLRARVARAVALGYQTVAVNVHVHQVCTKKHNNCMNPNGVNIHQDELTTKAKQGKTPKKKAKTDKDEEGKKELLDFPEPPNVEDVEGARVLKRLTIVFNDNRFAQSQIVMFWVPY
jgi:hypothetical protein